MITICVVFGDNDDINYRWITHHADLIPPEFEVLCVDNCEVLCVNTYNTLTYVCLSKDNWRAIHLPVDYAQGSKVHHGEALDRALPFVTTPYLVTMDSDCFIINPEIFDEFLKRATEGYAIVGRADKENNILPYIEPYCALYETNLARNIGFAPRFVEPQNIEPFLVSENKERDTWAAFRLKGFLDVGQAIHYEACKKRLPIIDDFPTQNFVIHHMSCTPHLIYTDAGKLAPHARIILPNNIPFHTLSPDEF